MAEGKPRALRAVARCSSLEEFIAGFARFAEPERLFIITPDPRPTGGPAQPFVIQLADGSTALRGVGEVVESHLIPTGPEGKCGMWLRLVELAPASVEVHRALLDQRARIIARIARASLAPAVPPADEPTNVSAAPPMPDEPDDAGAPVLPPLAVPPPADAARPGLTPLARLRPLPAPHPRTPGDPTPLGAPRAPQRPAIEIPPIGAPRARGTAVPPVPVPPAAVVAVPVVVVPVLPVPIVAPPVAVAPPAVAPPAVVPVAVAPVAPTAIPPPLVASPATATVAASAVPAAAPPPVRPPPRPAPATIGPIARSTSVAARPPIAEALPPAPIADAPPPPPPAIPLAARRTMIAAVAPPPAAIAAAHAAVPSAGTPGDRVSLTDLTPTPSRTPLPMSPSQEARDRARRLAGPSPFDEARAPGSPLQLPANPLAELPDEALGYFVECTLYEHTDLAELDGTWATVDAAVRVPTAPIAPIAGAPAAAVAPPAAPRRALFAVAALSATIGIGGGWLLFGRDRDPRSAPVQPAPPADRADPPAIASSTPAPRPAAAPPAIAPRAAQPAAVPAPPPPAIAARAPEVVAPPPASAPAVAPARAAAPPAPPAPTPPAPTPPTPAPAPAPGGCTLAITTHPAGVHATWSGADLGNTPLTAAQVPCGAGELVLIHPRYERVARTIDATATTAPIEVAMARPIGALTLRSIPPGATFTVNGATVGRGPTTAKVPAFESIHLTAQLAGYAPWHGTVKVRGATGNAFARLTRAR